MRTAEIARDDRRSSEPWRIVYTRPNAEKPTATQLHSRLGAQVFYPFTKTTERRRSRSNPQKARLVVTERAYFSRYVFVKGIEQQLPTVKALDGVCAIVHLKGQPVSVPISVMRTLLELADETGCVEVRDFTRPWLRSDLKVGDRFVFRSEQHILDGLIGQLSSIERLSDKAEVTAFVHMLGSNREVRVPVSIVGEVVRSV